MSSGLSDSGSESDEEIKPPTSEIQLSLPPRNLKNPQPLTEEQLRELRDYIEDQFMQLSRQYIRRFVVRAVLRHVSSPVCTGH